MFEAKLRAEAQEFLTYIFDALDGTKCRVSDFYLDHICYRVSEQEEYLYFKKELALFSTLISENIVNDRPIAIFKLNDPIVHSGRTIDVFELPAPKVGANYISGFEHIEFVIDKDLRVFVQENPHLNFNTKGIDKALNAEVRLKFKNGVVKFHTLSLLDVLHQENSNKNR